MIDDSGKTHISPIDAASSQDNNSKTSTATIVVEIDEEKTMAFIENLVTQEVNKPENKVSAKHITSSFPGFGKTKDTSEKEASCINSFNPNS